MRLREIFLGNPGGATLHVAATILTAIGVMMSTAILLSLLGAPTAAVAVASVPLGVMAGWLMDDTLDRLHLRLLTQSRSARQGTPE